MAGAKRPPGEPEEHPVGIDVLDELIGNYYKKLKETEGKDIKIGDFLKMVEMRKKLMPSAADQQKFWNMLDEIRKEDLPNDDKKPEKKKKKAKQQDG